MRHNSGGGTPCRGSIRYFTESEPYRKLVYKLVRIEQTKIDNLGGPAMGFCLAQPIATALMPILLGESRKV
jgi:hypothetical protein